MNKIVPVAGIGDVEVMGDPIPVYRSVEEWVEWRRNDAGGWERYELGGEKVYNPANIAVFPDHREFRYKPEGCDQTCDELTLQGEPSYYLYRRADGSGFIGWLGDFRGYFNI